MADKNFTAYTDETEVASDDALLVYDDSAGLVKYVTMDGLRGNGSGNLFRNYPSIEGANNTQPEWIEASNATLTEVADPFGNSPNSRLLKITTTAALGYAYMRIDESDEPTMAGGDELHFSCWIYGVFGGGEMRILLWDVDNAQTINSTATITTVGEWTFVHGNGTLASNVQRVDFIMRHTLSNKTFYVANPMITIGQPAPFRPRELRFRTRNAALYSSADPGGAAVTHDLNTGSGNTVAMARIKATYRNQTAASNLYAASGASVTNSMTTLVAVAEAADAYYNTNRFTVLCNDTGQFTTDSDAAGGDNETMILDVESIWEWA